MKNAKRCLLLLTSSMLLSSCIGSNVITPDDNGKTTTINFCHFQGTAGIDWLKEAAARFSEANKEVSFEEGKTGVKVNVSQTKQSPYDNLTTDGNDIYLFETDPDIYKLSTQNLLLDLTDVVTPLLPKIDRDAQKRMKGSDGKYYALPHYNWYTGVTYDVDLFDQKGFYFADPSESEDKVIPYSSKFGTARFVAGLDAKKSVGPNGIAGDYDDGLPSSMQELCILCDYIKASGKSPFLMAGKSSVYSFYLTTALWASLSGGDAMRDTFCNWTDAEVDVVTGYSSSEELFCEGSGIKAPTTKKEVLTSDNGYEIYSTKARYYALSFLELAFREGWFNEKALKNANREVIEAHDNFVREGNETGAILYDASYWCHEAENINAFKKWNQQHPGKKRNLSFMPLPTTYEGSVTTESEGKKPTLLNAGGSYLFANQKVESNPGKAKAVRAFISFLYQDSELAAFTEGSGLTIPMTYAYDKSKPDNLYYKNLNTIVADGEVINYASEDPRFLQNMSFFNPSYNARTNFYSVNGTQIQDGYMHGMYLLGATAQDIFQQTEIKKSDWDNMKH